MKRLFSTAAMTVAFSMAPATVGAHPFIVDQHNDGFVPPFYQNIQLLGPMGQEFTPSLAFLDVVELHTADLVSNDGGAALQLNIRALTIFGAILGTSLVVPLADGFFGVTHFDFPVPVPLVPGGSSSLRLSWWRGRTGVWVAAETRAIPAVIRSCTAPVSRTTTFGFEKASPRRPSHRHPFFSDLVS